MRILVYPHAMEVGGSQLNAIELAAAVRDRGHEVSVLSAAGPLVELVGRLGLDHVPLDPLARRRPSPRVAGQISRLVRDRGFDVVHGYEWPPGLEAFAGARLRRGVPAVCTVMSMAVPTFLPRSMPLLVGTEDLRRSAAAAGHRVTLLEPPVDVRANSPAPAAAAAFRFEHDLDPAGLLLAVVCRLVPELKAEGLLSACDAVGALAADGVPVQLAIVGAGPARDQVRAAAAEANAYAGRRVVVLTGELADPRPAYAAADVLLGMGGSALRGLAFGVPLVVQGERGFWRLLTPGTVDTFLAAGWYGIGTAPDAAAGRAVGALDLAAILRPLLADPGRRSVLGAFGRALVVERFGLDRAAGVQEEVYAAATRRARGRGPLVAADAGRSGAGVVRHQLGRKWQRRRGPVAADDFNAVAADRSPGGVR